jgi:hemolysin type calcium-binding protein
MPLRPRTAVVLAAVALLGPTAAGNALAKTPHTGWPRIDGDLIMHKLDESGPITATKLRRHNELLGGHGNDVITGGHVGDVIWGDYKPSGQPETQFDILLGRGGRDFVYGSHGANAIAAGRGDDVIHAKYGRGTIDCGSGRDVAIISHKSRPHYRIRHCEAVDF